VYKRQEEKEYQKLYKDIKAAFNKEFVTKSGRIIGETQTAYVLALKFDMVEDDKRDRAVEHLVKLIEDYTYVTCGFMGSPYILDVLSDNGHHELAQKLALKKDYPSWLYPVTMGATTIWERWCSLNEDGTPDKRVGMNSYNHYAYGSVANWFYQKIAGIIPDEAAPGYKHFYLRPHPSKELYDISTKLKTRYGTIGISYKIEDKNIYIDINIPDNTTCHLALPQCKAYIINSRRKKYHEEILLTPGEYAISYVMGGTMLNISIKEQFR
jgi:alpha-L-rhamnosidase